MNRRNICIAIIIVAAAVTALWRTGLLPGVSRDGSGIRPNIVLIIIDALRDDYLGCYGFKGNISPEIDRMAHEGALFENVIAQCSWTRPSIGSMLTSLYPRSLGIYMEKFDILHDRYLTFAEILKENGYATLGITANPNINSVFSFNQGFDKYIDSSVIWKWMRPERGKARIRQGIDLPRSAEIFETVLENAGTGMDTPAYIQINIMEVHSPELIRREYAGLFDKKSLDRRHKYCTVDSVLNFINKTHGAVRQVSCDINEFVEKLRAIPGWENTLFIMTSDHGQGLNDHPNVENSMYHGNLLYESQVRVPLILYHSGISESVLGGKRIKERIRLLDMMPTVLDYVGVDLPEAVHGRSVLDLITGDADDPGLPDCFFVETNWRDVNKAAVYSDLWKYIENHDGWEGVNEFELQPMGIKEDGMLTDRIDDYREAAEALKKLLYSWDGEYPKAERTQPYNGVSEKEIKQLKSLGYLD